MKPITQYTLQECLDAIRRGDYLNRHEIADRIERLVNTNTTLPCDGKPSPSEDANPRKMTQRDEKTPQ